MEQPSTEAVSENIDIDKDATSVTKGALESNEHINVHETTGHKVKTQLKVTGK
jgi:hypothetical protein